MKQGKRDNEGAGGQRHDRERRNDRDRRGALRWDPRAKDRRALKDRRQKTR